MIEEDGKRIGMNEIELRKKGNSSSEEENVDKGRKNLRIVEKKGRKENWIRSWKDWIKRKVEEVDEKIKIEKRGRIRSKKMNIKEKDVEKN